MHNQHRSKFTANSDNIKADYSSLLKNQEYCRFSPENNRLQAGDFGHIFAPVMAKSITSRRKLNDKPKANSTPTRAFFVRSIRTPQENQAQLGSVLLSMVGRKGQRLAVGCFPLVAVSYPFTLYRQAVGSEAESLNQPKDNAMLYKFLTQLNDRQLTITIKANSYAEALSRIQWHNRPICITRNLKTKGGVYA